MKSCLTARNQSAPGHSWGGGAPPLCDMPRSLRASKHSVRTIPSGPREIMRQFTLEFGEVARDHRHVEAPEYRLLWLAVEQESEGCLKAALRRMVPARQPVAHFTRHRDVVTSLAPCLANDHFEIERATLASAPDLDHGDLLGQNRRVARFPDPPVSHPIFPACCIWPGKPKRFFGHRKWLTPHGER